MKINVMDKLLSANDAWAEENRLLLRKHGITMLNIIGSPGAGKTTLLEQTIALLGKTIKMAVIEGDIATTKDAARIEKMGVAAYQINTGNACHLDAHLVNTALKELINDVNPELIFVENIGNLVCPAEFDIGEDGKIAVLSVTEGDDKVEKYPLLFSEAEILVITKLKLIEHTNFNLAIALAAFKQLNKKGEVITVDSCSGEGFASWIDFVQDCVLVHKIAECFK
ncbi:MAG: hydrogenase nickel incorporation protein HypB [Candidatus Omnitrophica bacterium]|nr:hydrogenase nickel incorporation protein HypB [Candidatus Omnitrophota bacterium]